MSPCRCQQCGGNPHDCEYPGSYCRWKIAARDWRDRVASTMKTSHHASNLTDDDLRSIAKLLREAYEQGKSER